MKTLKLQCVKPQCARHYSNPEFATPGEASNATNLRYKDNALMVVGRPTTRYSIPTGHRLLLVDDDYLFTLNGGTIYCNGDAVAQPSHEVLAMHRVGRGIVVVTRGDLIHLSFNGFSWQVVDQDDAVPHITLQATDSFTVQETLDAMTFHTPYSSWRAPLGADDEATLTTQYRNAWKDATRAITDQGAYYAPLMACYGVKLWDNNYLYFSNPVMLGRNTLDNVRHVTAQVTTASSRYTGIEATTMSMQGYRLGIAVAGGVGEQWRSLVKSIDVFVTPLPAIARTQSLDYRCITSQGAGRVPVLQYGWSAVPAALVEAALEASPWTMVASTTRIDELAQGRFVASNVVYNPGSTVGSTMVPLQGDTITREMVDEVMKGITMLSPVASMVRNGRLYLASQQGQVACSAHGNALSFSQVTQVSGATIRAIAPVSRPIYSGGFGRYAVYLFTSEGIYAVAQSARGALGEARLVDRTIIASDCVPVEGNRDVYFVDRHSRLCRLEGSVVYHLMPHVEPQGTMVWDDAHAELYLIDAQGGAMAVSARGYYSHRTIDAVALYGDQLHSLAITATGSVVDLGHEDDDTMPIAYHSHPIVVGLGSLATVHEAYWRLGGNASDLAVSLYGSRGGATGNFLMGGYTLNGTIDHMLPMPIVASPCRTISISVQGNASTGSIFHPVNVMLCQSRK